MGIKLKNKNRKFNKPLYVFVAVLLVLAGLVSYYYINGWAEKNGPDTTSQPLENKSQKSLESSEKGSEKNKEEIIHEPEKNIVPAYSGEDVSSSPSLTGVVGYKSVIDGALVIRTTINQTVSTGNCELKLVGPHKTITKNSTIIQNPSSSTCEGFSVPVNELGSGEWQIEITINSNDKKGVLKDKITI